MWRNFGISKRQQHVSVPLEELFMDLGERSQVEDIENFASVFYTAKRTGGDMNRVIQKVARMLGDKIDVKKEIEATLAAKKSEQMIMSFMPAGIIIVPSDDFAGILKCSLWKSLWNCRNEYLPGCLCNFLLAWQKDRRYRGITRRMWVHIAVFGMILALYVGWEKGLEIPIGKSRKRRNKAFYHSCPGRQCAGNASHSRRQRTGVLPGISTGKGGYRIL